MRSYEIMFVNFENHKALQNLKNLSFNKKYAPIKEELTWINKR